MYSYTRLRFSLLLRLSNAAISSATQHLLFLTAFTKCHPFECLGLPCFVRNTSFGLTGGVGPGNTPVVSCVRANVFERQLRWSCG